jgi:hypothetical protein
MKHSQYILCTLLAASAQLLKAQEMRISDGLNISLDGPVHLVLNNMRMVNNGQFKADNGTVLFTGSSNSGSVFIGGSSPIQFHHLTVDFNSGDLQLQNRLFISGDLTLLQGNIDLNNYNIDLGTTGRIVGESRYARITSRNGGYVKATTNLNEPRTINPGNLGLQLTTNKNMGITTITRGHVQQVNAKGELSIQRYYDVASEFASNIQAEVVADFLDVESTSINSNEISLWRSQDGGRNWTTVAKNNNTYVIDDANRFQPLRLTYFKGKPDNNSISAAYIQLYPNPVVEKFTLLFSYQKQEELTINLYNQSGQLLETRRIKTFNGLNKLDWQVGKYPGGNYQLRLIADGVRNLSFTKQ